MGGRALKNTETRRYQRGEFEILSNELFSILRQTFDRVEMPLFYKNKQSFGDADILVTMPAHNWHMRDYIQDTFNPNEIFHNGNCWSFDYKELQVDLITTSEEDFDTNLFYFSYNDLGNMVGRLAHGFGLKFGQEGLWLEYYFGGNHVGDIQVSKDFRKIYEFLGLSYDRYLEGFDELVDIFEFITTSPYFNWKKFQLSELNKINRDRNKKRTSYVSFLEWVDNNVADSNHEYEYYDDKSLYFSDIINTFPDANILIEMRRMEFEYARNRYIKAKFNGGDVMRKYGFQGKELGDILNGFKNFVEVYYVDFFDNFLLAYDVEDIYAKFDTYLSMKTVIDANGNN